jgi:hypothetical protein
MIRRCNDGRVIMHDPVGPNSVLRASQRGRRRLGLTILLPAAALSLAACGGGGGGGVEVPEPAPPTALVWNTTNWDEVNWQ